MEKKLLIFNFKIGFIYKIIELFQNPKSMRFSVYQLHCGTFDFILDD